MALVDGIEKAFFTVEGKDEQISVHFNPQSLQYVITNTLKNQGNSNKKKQHVSQSTGKLSFDLIFDTTDTGQDVRIKTIQVAKFMEPKKNKVPPVINFEWGLYKFTGMVDSYKETIDFFSPSGVPLRAGISLSMSQQDKVFDGGVSQKNSGGKKSPSFPNDSLPASSPPGKGVTDIATKGGNPEAGRAIGESNSLESLRFPGKGELEVSESFPLKSPQAFASVGLGGGSLGGGLDLGASAGVGLSAGVSATAGAFSGLRVKAKPPSSKFKIDMTEFSESEVTAKLGMEDASSIGIGGKAGLKGSASLKAEVGKAGDLSARLQFEDS